jgi:hypothetical protein
MYRKLLPLALFVLSSACGPKYLRPQAVTSQAAPNPLVGVKSYTFAPVTWSGFTFGDQSEAAWLATRTPEQQQGWKNDKEAITQRIFERLQVEADDGESITMLSGTPAAGSYVIRVNVDRFENTPEQGGGMFVSTVRITDAHGKVVDEVVPPVYWGTDWGIALQLNTFVVWLASDTWGYLRTRYAPPPAPAT